MYLLRYSCAFFISTGGYFAKYHAFETPYLPLIPFPMYLSWAYSHLSKVAASILGLLARFYGVLDLILSPDLEYLQSVYGFTQSV